MASRLTEEEIERKVRRYRSKVTDEIDDHRRRKEQKFHEFFKDRKMCVRAFGRPAVHPATPPAIHRPFLIETTFALPVPPARTGGDAGRTTRISTPS